MKNKLLALVPMKGHSERVVNKNMKIFAGRPLCCYILETLLTCPIVDRVYVDTDSDDIQNVIKNQFDEVEVIIRPERLRGDYVSMNDIIAYDLTEMQESDYYLQTHATNPLLTSETICRAFEQVCGCIEQEADSLFSVNRIQTRLYDGNGEPLNHNPQELIRTQDLEPIFEENSNMYFFTKTSFLKNNMRIGEKPIMYEMDKNEAIDIDEEYEFRLAEQIYFSARRNNNEMEDYGKRSIFNS